MFRLRADVAPGSEVRAQAAKLNARVIRDGVSLDKVLTDVTGLQGREQSLLRALLFGSFRWHQRLQWQLGKLLTRPLKRNDLELGALLRQGLLQMQEFRIPDHAAVSATVEAASLLGMGRARGLVNAVLRRYQQDKEALNREMQDNPEALLSHPAWLIERIKQDWEPSWQRILEANNIPAPMWLRVNAARLDTESYLMKLSDAGLSAQSSQLVATGLLLSEPRPTSALPGFSEGLVSVQDGAAQLAAGYLNLRPGLRVLDTCAAPGGKTAHILESCPDLDEVLALDRDPDRLALVEENLARLKLTATTCACDATRASDWWDGRPFDRILVDAPCSATGVIRRHPDIKVLRSEGDVARAVDVQASLLNSAWPLLKPGGRMLYSTCTVLRQENHEQIARFLVETADAVLVGPGVAGHLQMLPGEENMDGFYYACIDKQNT